MDYLSNEAREVSKLYGILLRRGDGTIERLHQRNYGFDVDDAGWEHATDVLLRSASLDRWGVEEHYRSGFHMYENIKDAFDRIDDWIDETAVPPKTIIIVAFEWTDMRAQGKQAGKNVSVVGSRAPLYMVWDSRYQKRGG
ncbi:MAG: hypothetical protein SVY53_05205 [Chloroflexota bacterium]|nr:hypothetical protein [Chloroflexota bacterium]